MLDAIRYEALPRSDRTAAIVSDLRALADAIEREKYAVTRVETAGAIDGSPDFLRFDLKLTCFIRPDKD